MTVKAAALVTAQDVAERLAVEIETVRRMTRKGELAAVAVNLGSEQRPMWRYDPARLEKWIDTRRAA